MSIALLIRPRRPTALNTLTLSLFRRHTHRKLAKSLRTIYLRVSFIEMEHRISCIRWIIIMNHIAENTSRVRSILTQLVMGYPFHNRRALIGSFKTKANCQQTEVTGPLSRSSWGGTRDKLVSNVAFQYGIKTYWQSIFDLRNLQILKKTREINSLFQDQFCVWFRLARLPTETTRVFFRVSF